jgi:stringent starvation protein B
MVELSTKPYLIRAIYEWCADCGFTPYLRVKVDQHTRVPMEFVKNGEIVLSVSQSATRDLTIGNDVIQFSARFNGVSREIAVPIQSVLAAFAKENGRGVYFEPETAQAPAVAPASTLPLAAVPRGQAASSEGDRPPPSTPGKPKVPPRGNLRVVK